jgi:hypothetical protein
VRAEDAAATELACEGHLVRLWRPPVTPGQRKALGLYRADSEAQLDGLTPGYSRLTMQGVARRAGTGKAPLADQFDDQREQRTVQEPRLDAIMTALRRAARRGEIRPGAATAACRTGPGARGRSHARR